MSTDYVVAADLVCNALDAAMEVKTADLRLGIATAETFIPLLELVAPASSPLPRLRGLMSRWTAMTGSDRRTSPPLKRVFQALNPVFLPKGELVGKSLSSPSSVSAYRSADEFLRGAYQRTYSMAYDDEVWRAINHRNPHAVPMPLDPEDNLAPVALQLAQEDLLQNGRIDVPTLAVRAVARARWRYFLAMGNTEKCPYTGLPRSFFATSRGTELPWEDVFDQLLQDASQNPYRCVPMYVANVVRPGLRNYDPKNHADHQEMFEQLLQYSAMPGRLRYSNRITIRPSAQRRGRPPGPANHAARVASGVAMAEARLRAAEEQHSAMVATMIDAEPKPRFDEPVEHDPLVQALAQTTHDSAAANGGPQVEGGSFAAGEAPETADRVGPQTSNMDPGAMGAEPVAERGGRELEMGDPRDPAFDLITGHRAELPEWAIPTMQRFGLMARRWDWFNTVSGLPRLFKAVETRQITMNAVLKAIETKYAEHDVKKRSPLV